MSVAPRMNRLFGANGKCAAIAMDHALFNDVSLLRGVERMDQLVSRVASAGPDAILLAPGQAHYLQQLKLNRKPALILRCDVSNIYSPQRPDYSFSEMIEAPVEQALELDAAAVLLNLFYAPDDPDVYHQCVRNIWQIKVDCERFGMPLIAEPLVMVEDPESEAYAISGDRKLVMPLIRQAIELGVHVVKSDPTDSPERYRDVVEIAGKIPLLPRGGGKVDDKDILTRTRHLIDAGAAGIVYGRNVFQHADVEGMVAAIMSLVHAGASVDDAARKIS